MDEQITNELELFKEFLKKRGASKKYDRFIFVHCSPLFFKIIENRSY